MSITNEHRLTVDDFPDELKRRLKANAAMAGVSMRAACIEAIRGWVEDHDPAPVNHEAADRVTAAAKDWRRRDE
jgi:plasmid stability protein